MLFPPGNGLRTMCRTFLPYGQLYRAKVTMISYFIQLLFGYLGTLSSYKVGKLQAYTEYARIAYSLGVRPLRLKS